MPTEHLVKDEDDFEEDTLFDQAGLLTNKIKRHSDIHNVNNTMRITPMKTFALCLAFFGLGLSFSIVEPTLLDLQALAGTDSQHIFYIITSRSVGYILGSVLGILLFDRYNRQFLLFLSMLGMTVFLGILPWCNNLIAYIIILLILGMLMQLLYAGGNVLCLDLWGRQSGPFLQAIHFSLSLGLFIAPLLSNTISVGKTGVPLAETSNKLIFNNSCIIALPASSLYNVHFSAPITSHRHRRNANFSDSFDDQENTTLVWNSSSIYNTHEESLPNSLNSTVQNSTFLESSNHTKSNSSEPLNVTPVTLSPNITNANVTINTTATTMLTNMTMKPAHKPKPPATYAKHLSPPVDKWARNSINDAPPQPVLTSSTAPTTAFVTALANVTSSAASLSSINITVRTTDTNNSSTSITPKTVENLINTTLNSGNIMNDSSTDFIYTSTFTEEMLSTENGSLEQDSKELDNSPSSATEAYFVTNSSDANISPVETKSDENKNNKTDSTPLQANPSTTTNDPSFDAEQLPRTNNSENGLHLPTTKPSGTSTLDNIQTTTQETTTESTKGYSVKFNTDESEKSSLSPKLEIYFSSTKKDNNISVQTDTETMKSSPTATENDDISVTLTETPSPSTSTLSSGPAGFPSYSSSTFNITYIDSSSLKSRGKKLNNVDKGIKNNTSEGKIITSQSTVNTLPSVNISSTVYTLSTSNASTLTNVSSTVVSPDIKTVTNCSQNIDSYDNRLTTNIIHKKPDTFNNQTEEPVLLLTDLMNKINELGISKVHIVYAVMALIVFLTSLVFLSFLCQNPRELRSKQEEGVKTGVPESKFTSIMVGLAFVLIIFYASAQLVFSQLYLSLVLQQSTHLLSSRGSLLISVFWGVYAFSRATSICCTNGFKPATMLVVDFCCCIFSATVLAIFGSRIESLLWCSVAIMAIGLSSVFPYCLLWLEDYIHISNKTACIILLGGSSVDLILSLTFGHQIVISSTTVMYLVLVCCVLALLIFGIMWRLATWRGDKYGCCKAETQYHLASQIDDEEDSMEFSSGNTSLYLLNNGTNFSLSSWDRKNENSYIPLKHKKSKLK